jgi:membrane-associated protease RseP (regulator of RpoE activity)
MSASFLWSLGGFFLVLTPIILVHELGHFWAARLSNIRVEEFGFGFPASRSKNCGTEWNGLFPELDPAGWFRAPCW